MPLPAGSLHSSRKANISSAKFANPIKYCTFAILSEREGNKYVAGVLKLVDKPDLGSGAVRRMGSIPFARTRGHLHRKMSLFLYAAGREVLLPELDAAPVVDRVVADVLQA